MEGIVIVLALTKAVTDLAVVAASTATAVLFAADGCRDCYSWYLHNLRHSESHYYILWCRCPNRRDALPR
jgi:hypothetical protein